MYNVKIRTNLYPQCTVSKLLLYKDSSSRYIAKPNWSVKM